MLITCAHVLHCRTALAALHQPSPSLPSHQTYPIQYTHHPNPIQYTEINFPAHLVQNNLATAHQLRSIPPAPPVIPQTCLFSAPILCHASNPC